MSNTDILRWFCHLRLCKVNRECLIIIVRHLLLFIIRLVIVTFNRILSVNHKLRVIRVCTFHLLS